jgi:thioredoxin 1
VGDRAARSRCPLAFLLLLIIAVVTGCSGERKSTADGAASGAAAVPPGEALPREAGVVPQKAPDGTRLPRLVELGGEKCIPCRQMAPILEEVGKAYAGRLIVEKLDVQKDASLGRQWKVRVIPTQVFLDAQGKEIARHEGFLEREAILAQLSLMGLKAGGAVR